jgi:hypothetical protein
MPRIREYTTQTTADANIPSRRAQAEDFGGGGGTYRFGQALQGVGQDMGNGALFLAQQESRDEVTDVHTQLAKANAEWTLHLNESVQTAAPGDDTIAPKFLERFDDYVSKLGERYQTRNGRRAFELGAASMRGAFAEQAFGRQAQLAGVHAKQQFQSALDASRNALVNDPSQFHRLLGSTHAALNDTEGSYVRIPAEQREPLNRLAKEQLAYSAVQGYMKLSPELAIKQLNGGQWDEYLDADKKTSLMRGAEVEINRREAESVRVNKEAERAEQEVIIQRLAANKLTASDILQSNLRPTGEGSKEHFLNVLRTRSREVTEAPIKTIPSVMLDLFTRIHAADGDPGKITSEAELNNAYINKRLSFEDFNRLRKEVADARTPDGEKLGKRRTDFVNGVAAQLDKSNPLMGKIDASDKQQVYEFGYYVDRKIEAYRKAGKDAHDLFDPSSPDYLGKPEVLAGFQKTLAQSMKDYSDGLRRQSAGRPTGGVSPGGKARQPGETVQQYLERTGTR